MGAGTIQAARALGADDRAAVAALLAAAQAHDGEAHPLPLDGVPDDAPPEAIHYLLARGGDALVGAAHLAGYGEVEVTGLVHPDHRRRGIGRRLLEAAQAEVARRGLASWLLVCDAAFPAGAPFAAACGGSHTFAEHRLRLDPARLPPPPPSALLAVRPAAPADADDLAAILSAAFGDPLAEVRGWMGGEFGRDDRRWYVASLAQAPVGTLRVRLGEPEGTYITGFGIAPAYQGQRLGRQFLLTILAELRAAGHESILIEVETDNAPANALYRAVGFVPIRTFDYFRFAV